MGDYNKPVHSREPDPYENISINPIEKDKKNKEEFSNLPRDSSSSQMLATLFSYCKRIISLFKFKDEKDFQLISQQELFEHIREIRNQLLILSEKDESHNPKFTQELTEVWHKLLDDCNSIAASSDISSQTINNIKFFISQVSSYPLKADHTLGYYLKAFAGKDWIPFPFMDLLQELHTEYVENLSNSHLGRWLFVLNEILSARLGQDEIE